MEALAEVNPVPEDGIVTKEQFQTVAGKDMQVQFTGQTEEGITYVWTYDASKIQNPQDQNLNIDFIQDGLEEIKKQANNAEDALGITMYEKGVITPPVLQITLPASWKSDAGVLLKEQKGKLAKMSDVTIVTEDPETKENETVLMILATMAALACAGRAAFFMLPNFKPIIAVVIVSGIAFGGEAGFLVGAMTMLVSNFLFGQGPWTPWQMFAMGFIGFLSGILYQKGWLPTRRFRLSFYGFLVTVFLYGGIMNPAAMFMSMYEFTWTGLLAYYISGIPIDCVHGISTFIFLWFGARPLLEKLQRIKVKYGLL